MTFFNLSEIKVLSLAKDKNSLVKNFVIRRLENVNLGVEREGEALQQIKHFNNRDLKHAHATHAHAHEKHTKHRKIIHPKWNE